jgi:hypothetical protein
VAHLSAAAGGGDFKPNMCYSLMSFWIKLHGFTPGDLPHGGMRDLLAHWMLSRPMALAASAQPGCTLLKFDFLLPEDVAARVRARGVSELAVQVGEGPLGANGDYAVGIDGDVAQATETRRGGSEAGEGEEVRERRAFIISTSSATAGEVLVPASSPVPDSGSVMGLQVISNPCVCSSGGSEERDLTVIVRLPCHLPLGGRIECRARGRIIPVTLTELRHSPDGAYSVDAHLVISPTGLNGVAMLEVVHGDGTPCGVPAAVLVFAADASLVSTMNAVGRLHARRTQLTHTRNVQQHSADLQRVRTSARSVLCSLWTTASRSSTASQSTTIPCFDVRTHTEQILELNDISRTNLLVLLPQEISCTGRRSTTHALVVRLSTITYLSAP